MDSDVYVRLCVSGLTIITAVLGGAICIVIKFHSKIQPEAETDELKKF